MREPWLVALQLDMTVTLGNVLQIGATIAAVLLAYGALRERLVRIETQLSPVWQDWVERRSHSRRAEDRE